MDQFSAHLDRGWELISRNDPRGAEASARRAIELDPQSPEAYNLLGYCAALEGNADEAVEAYLQAIALDDTFFEAMLNAAEVYIHPLHEFEEAVSMCDQALELAETNEEVVDTLLLKFDALSGLGEEHFDEARALLEQLPGPPYESPAHTFLVGRALYEGGLFDRAVPLIEEAVAREPKHADAWYYLGLLHDERGEIPAATEAFLKARSLDLASPPPPWALEPDAFLRLCRGAVAQLDGLLRGYVRQAEMYVAELPGVEMVVDGVDPRAMLVFDMANPADEPTQVCARIFFYQRNIERVAGFAEQVEDEIRAALEREITMNFVDEGASERAKKELN